MQSMHLFAVKIKATVHVKCLKADNLHKRFEMRLNLDFIALIHFAGKLMKKLQNMAQS